MYNICWVEGKEEFTKIEFDANLATNVKILPEII